MSLIYPWPTFSTKTQVFTQSQKYPQAPCQENLVLGYPNMCKIQQNQQWYIFIDHNRYAGMCLIYPWPLFITKPQVFTQSQKYPQAPWQENMVSGYPNMCKHQQNHQWYILIDHNNYAGMSLIYPWPTFSTKTQVFTQSQKFPQAPWQENMVSGYPNIINYCLSAIEIYNKPDFKYREEIFSVLAVKDRKSVV